MDNSNNTEDLKYTLKNMINEFLPAADLEAGGIVVLGCSTSEIAGGIIGKASEPLIGEMIINILLEVLKPLNIWLAVQCCEHLNRALVVEKKCAKENGLEIVAVVPQEKAGGSAATAAYRLFENPVLAEFIKADAGIDIGNTFIGMHLKHVAVPVRLSVNKLGGANVTFAKTRPKYIGGERAKYM
jgi:uncharacterized protein (TIGR01440 family)